MSLTSKTSCNNLEDFRNLLPLIIAEGRVFDYSWYINSDAVQYLKVLVEAGFNANEEKCEDGMNCLHYAASFRNLDMLSYLVKDLRVNTNHFTNAGDHVLHLVLYHCMFNFNDYYLRFLDILLSQPDLLPDLTNRKGLTPIHYIAHHNKKNGLKIVKQFLEKRGSDIDLDSTSVNGKTVRQTLQTYWPQLTLSNCYTNITNEITDTLLHMIQEEDEQGFCETINLHWNHSNMTAILKSNYPAQHTTDLTYTLLQHACAKGTPLIVRTLLEKGADVNAVPRTRFGEWFESAMEIALLNNHLDIAEILLSWKNLSRGTFKSDGKTLQHVLVTTKFAGIEYQQFVKKFLESASLEEVEYVDINGRTALHEAVIHDNTTGVHTLLDKGASLQVLDGNKEAPINCISYDILKKYLDSKVRDNGYQENMKDYMITLDYSTIMKTGKTRKFLYLPPKLLTDIKREEHLKPLLQHPLLSTLISIKWRLYRAFYYFAVFVYSMYCLSLTAYIHSASSVAHVFAWLFFTVICIFEFFYWLADKRLYMHSLDGIIRLFNILLGVLVLSLKCDNLISCTDVDDNCLNICSHVAAWAVLVAWCEIFFIVGKHLHCVVYVKLFRSAFIVLIKFFCIHLPLMFGFAFSFNVLFGTSPTLPKTIMHWLFKTVVMLTGEYNASDIPFQKTPGSSQLIFLAFICLMVIVLYNILIGLASGETSHIEENSYQIQQEAQVWIMSLLKEAFFVRRPCLCICSCLMKYIYGKKTGQIIEPYVTVWPNKNNRMPQSFVFYVDWKDNILLKDYKDDGKRTLDAYIVEDMKKIIKLRKKPDITLDAIKKEISGLKKMVLEMQQSKNGFPNETWRRTLQGIRFADDIDSSEA